MEPNTIEESIKGLLEAIKESPEYLEFQKQSDILKKKPELKARVDTFRADNYKVQNECDSDNLFEVVEQMGKEYRRASQTPGSECVSGCGDCFVQNDAENLYKTGRGY